MEQSRLRWQCRRGMRELDVLLSNWLDENFAQLSSTDILAFQRLLSLQDPELAGYLLHGGSADDPEIARVVEQIRGPAPG